MTMKTTIATALAALIVVPAFAQPTFRLQIPPPTGNATPAKPASGNPAPGSVFQAECVKITGMNGNSELQFQCQKADGSTVQAGVARNYDQSGAYYVGHDQSTQAGIEDTQTLVGVSQAVVAFMLLKAVNPGSKAVLTVSGVYSKLSAAKAAPVVQAAYFTVQ